MRSGPWPGPPRLVLDLDTSGSGGDGAPVVRGDPERLRQLLLNLAANALRFTPAGGQVVRRLDGPRPAVARPPAHRSPGRCRWEELRVSDGEGRSPHEVVLGQGAGPGHPRATGGRRPDGGEPGGGADGLGEDAGGRARRAGGRASARPETARTGTAAVAGSALRSPSSAPPER